MKRIKALVSQKWIVVGLIISAITMATIYQMNKSQTAELQAEAQQEVGESAILSPKIEMGVVELNVADLAIQRRFYEDLVGLETISETDSTITLGYQEREVIRLIHTPDLPIFPRNSAGLYHTAIVFESRATLAQVVLNILQNDPGLYEGTSDHLVSEAFYFHDPEGNGVELYFDKDPSTWQWENGRVVMGSSYIDPEEYIRTYAQASAVPAKKMGHIHLQVGDIARAKQFYGDILGFAITSEMPTALFVSDGKYHHQIGMNVWQSAGSGQRTETRGLKSFTILLSDETEIESLKNRLDEANVTYEESENLVIVHDPWGTVITFGLVG